MKLRFFWSLVFSVMAGLAVAGEARQFAVHETALIVHTAKGDVRFELEFAGSSSERAAGLMFRHEFPNNRAMLFNFEATRPVSMWMKNTPLSLDMLFVDESGVIAGITENTRPFSLDVLSSPKPVQYVLEINAGQVAANAIMVGDKLVHPLIEPN